MTDSQTTTSSQAVIGATLLADIGSLLSDEFGRGMSHEAPVSAKRPPLCAQSIEHWRSWASAQREHLALLILRQRLEARMFDIAEFPHVDLRRRGDATSILVETNAEIDAWCDNSPAHMSAARKAKRELAALRRLWRRADEKTGYSRAMKQEQEASDRVAALAAILSASEARSVADVMAKLHVLVVHGQPSAQSCEFPWPELRSVLSDLFQMTTMTQDPAHVPKAHHSFLKATSA